MDLSLTRGLLIDLAQHRPQRDLGAIAPAFADIGRALAKPSPDEVRATLAALAALRESIEWDEPANRVPLQALRGDKSGAYSGGALWATSLLLSSLLSQLGAEDDRAQGFSQRHQAREAIVALAAKCGVISPTDVREFLRERVDIKADTVSKAISELLAIGALEECDPPSAGDRRLRYYRATDTTPQDAVIAETRDRATAALRELAAVAGPDSVREAVEAAAQDTPSPRAWRTYGRTANRA